MAVSPLFLSTTFQTAHERNASPPWMALSSWTTFRLRRGDSSHHLSPRADGEAYTRRIPIVELAAIFTWVAAGFTFMLGSMIRFGVAVGTTNIWVVGLNSTLG